MATRSARLSFFVFSSRRRHTRYIGDWSSDVCSSDLFRLVNDLPDALYPAFWEVMQAGNVLAVGVASLVVAATRRFWLAINLAVTGVGVWLAARWIKDQVGRERPADLLDGVHLRGPHDNGLGFVSGHAA